MRGINKVLLLICIFVFSLSGCIEYYYYRNSDYYLGSRYHPIPYDRYIHNNTDVIYGWYESKNKYNVFYASINDIYNMGVQRTLDHYISSLTYYNDIYNYRYHFSKNKQPKYKGYDIYRYRYCSIITAKLYYHNKLIKEDVNTYCT